VRNRIVVEDPVTGPPGGREPVRSGWREGDQRNRGARDHNEGTGHPWHRCRATRRAWSAHPL